MFSLTMRRIFATIFPPVPVIPLCVRPQMCQIRQPQPNSSTNEFMWLQDLGGLEKFCVNRPPGSRYPSPSHKGSFPKCSIIRRLRKRMRIGRR